MSFKVEPGEVVGLIGPNGAGKTTLLDVVTGFTAARSGSVRFDGDAIDGWSVERRARAGIVRSWQAVELFEEMTVRDNLLVAADDQSGWRYLADLVRPGRRAGTAADRRAGRGARTSAACSTSGRRRCPTACPGSSASPGRSSPSRRCCCSTSPPPGSTARRPASWAPTIRSMAARLGIGILVVEHDVPLLLQTCDRIVVLDFGRKIAEGTPEEISGDAGVIEAYLGAADGDAGGGDDVTPLLEASGLRAGYGNIEVVRGLDLRGPAGRGRGAARARTAPARRRR